ncbi:hypothetical protein [Lichenibacterium dinghuense]|uniref:hypothetical protein n=1 Tax=Lichenibacterium dinghuense TaxID=2895977 RepID=UPI001F366A3D|nr:hypothetical protein [Lichenibacterium sp. 6Y81]
MTSPAVTRARLAAAALLLGVYLFGLGRVAMLPPFEGYDETGHYSYVAQVAAAGTVPARGDPMSAETEDYARRAPVPAAAGRRLSYADVATAGPEARAAVRDAAAAPTADPRWRGGAGANWEAQHPPLFYALLAPAFRWADAWSLRGRLALLRGLSYTLACGGLLCAAWAASGLGRAGRRDPQPAALAVLAPALWPILLPEWFPEMARLGNDALVCLLAGLTGLGLRLLLAGRAGLLAHAGVGAVVGVGLLTKATVLPLAAAAGLVLAGAALLAPRAERGRRLGGVACFALAAVAVAGWWYLGQFLRTGDPIGANDGVNLARGEGLWRGLQHHLSVAALLRIAYDFDLSLVWNGTWSFAVPPLASIAPMMVAAPAIAVAGMALRPRPGRALDALAPLTLALFTAALVYYSLVLIAGGGLGQPAWYLHGFAPVLWPLLAWAVEGARRSSPLRVLLAADLVYALLFLAFATACDAAVYAGCAGTRGGDRYIDVAAAALCWAEPVRLYADLSLLAWPDAAAWLLGAGFASAALGAGLGLSLLRRGPAVGEDPEP